MKNSLEGVYKAGETLFESDNFLVVTCTATKISEFAEEIDLYGVFNAKTGVRETEHSILHNAIADCVLLEEELRKANAEAAGLELPQKKGVIEGVTP